MVTNDATILHDQNQICVNNCTETMGSDDSRFVFASFLEIIDDCELCLSIHS